MTSSPPPSVTAPPSSPPVNDFRSGTFVTLSHMHLWCTAVFSYHLSGLDLTRSTLDITKSSSDLNHKPPPQIRYRSRSYHHEPPLKTTIDVVGDMKPTATALLSQYRFETDHQQISVQYNGHFFPRPFTYFDPNKKEIRYADFRDKGYSEFIAHLELITRRMCKDVYYCPDGQTLCQGFATLQNDCDHHEFLE
ncbi:unnamed protein product [Lactuca saligna]|uniref:Uncharacterized protein n=1 Tax=Lactuca saligna TaxID=75948 RepID=A0AA35ZPM3_LACSI|nr:unnamed protein product [Lactuca saligna]CAI9296361.1 unnamed protein product [Lactuca saligna]